MKILVTGGGGFIGRYIVEMLLQRGDHVTVFSRSEHPEVRALGARVIRGDLGDPQQINTACTGVDTVFHVAAKAGIWGPRAEFDRTNVSGTENVITACRSNGVAKLVFTSSPSVIFDGRPHDHADESLPYPASFLSVYAETKARAERSVLAANNKALATVALRPHLVFGPRDPHLLPRLITQAKHGHLIQVGAGNNHVDLTFVEDAARAHLLAADGLATDSPSAGNAYFITQNEPVNLWQWIDALLQELALPPVRRAISLRTAQLIGGITEFAYRSLHLHGEPRMTRFLAGQLALDHCYSLTKASQDLGFQPRITMAHALERTLPSLREQLK